jgi:AraC family transcriptional regulator
VTDFIQAHLGQDLSLELLAQQLLRETDAPLAQVAQESGFASQSHLTHVFTRHLGLTPRAYRHH